MSTFRKRGMILTALALAMILAATLLPSVAQAHDGEFHATATAEGGSTRVTWDNPDPGIPPQEYWLDTMVAVKHRYDPVTAKNWYRPTFKVNSWKGVFTPDGWAPGDAMAVDYNIKLGLLLYDQNTGIITPVSTYDYFFTNGNGWSYGCQGDGRETHIAAQPGKMVVASLLVHGQRKYWSQLHTSWLSVPGTFGYHQTRSYRLGTVWVPAEPSSLGHGYETDSMTGFLVNWVGSSPQATIRGYCPIWTTVM